LKPPVGMVYRPSGPSLRSGEESEMRQCFSA
jgi:hypothetical protein